MSKPATPEPPAPAKKVSDPELVAMSRAVGLLEPLDRMGRMRVLSYLNTRFLDRSQLVQVVPMSSATTHAPPESDRQESE